MIFFFYPVGADMRDPRRGLVSYALAAVIAFRGVMSYLHPGLKIDPRRVLAGGLDWASASSVLQSLVSPVLSRPGTPADHRLVLLLGFVFTVALWALAGPVLETAVGRLRTLLLFLAGGGLTLVATESALFGKMDVVWLGLGATVFCAGVLCVVGAFADLRVAWMMWTPFTGSHSSTWGVPILFGMVPFMLLAVLGQSAAVFVPKNHDPTIQTGLYSPGVIGPEAWLVLLALLGAGTGAAMLKLSIARRVEGGP
jgi:hypothetical protein